MSLETLNGSDALPQKNERGISKIETLIWNTLNKISPVFYSIPQEGPEKKPIDFLDRFLDKKTKGMSRLEKTFWNRLHKVCPVFYKIPDDIDDEWRESVARKLTSEYAHGTSLRHGSYDIASLERKPIVMAQKFNS